MVCFIVISVTSEMAQGEQTRGAKLKNRKRDAVMKRK